MPTVLLLDVSLSMLRPVQTADPNENHTRLSLASVAINTFLDYLNAQLKLEHVALVTFSSNYEVAVPFTRDYDTIRTKLQHLEEGDKTCIDTALLGVNQLVLNEWGHQNLVQIILITDGAAGVGSIGRNRIIQSLPLPSNYPARVHVLPIAEPQDQGLHNAMPLYQKIAELASSGTNVNIPPTRGVVYCPDQLTVASINTAMNRLTEQQYAPCFSTLKCGQLESKIQLYPAMALAINGSKMAPACIHVIGFISTQDLGTPITMSRHLIIPQASQVPPTRDNNFDPKTPTKDGPVIETPTEDESDPSKIPNFCVLLHGALKVEKLSCIVQAGGEVWGAVSAWCDGGRARRSCLVLGAFPPAADAAPWLGPLHRLGPPPASLPAAESFPIRATRSYSSGATSGGAWARPHALLADVQKVLRHARKLPDKTQQLYKELNRLRRMAISLGFTSLLNALGAALDRERLALPAHTPSEAALQLAHCAAALRDPHTQLDCSVVLTPVGSVPTTQM